MGNSGEVDLREKNVAFWCDSVFGFYTLKPIVEKYQHKKYTIYIYTMQKDIKILENYLEKISNIKVISIESINSFYLRVLNYAFKRFLTNPNFTQMHFRHRKKDRDSFYHKYLGNLFYIDNKKINIVYQSFFGLFNNRLKSNFLISISRVKANHLICSKKIKHISIMESWDHPVKSPYWHKPHVLLTWNKDLKKDYQEFQGFKDVKISHIKLLKFRYIEERLSKDVIDLEKDLKNESFLEDINFVKKKNIVMYITTTSSINPIQHDGEIKLIEQLCIATEKLGKTLYIKPKPNGPQGDYDIFKYKFENIIVGTYATNLNSVDMLDEEYHTFRYLLLYYSKLIVNFGTTFVLESALMDKPILQLNLSKKYYGKFGEYSNNLHIQKYLLNEYSVKIKDENDLIEILQIKQEQFELYSNGLKKWITNR